MSIRDDSGNAIYISLADVPIGWVYLADELVWEATDNSFKVFAKDALMTEGWFDLSDGRLVLDPSEYVPEVSTPREISIPLSKSASNVWYGDTVPGVNYKIFVDKLVWVDISSDGKTYDIKNDTLKVTEYEFTAKSYTTYFKVFSGGVAEKLIRV